MPTYTIPHFKGNFVQNYPIPITHFKNLETAWFSQIGSQIIIEYVCITIKNNYGNIPDWKEV